ncbi:flagellar protein FlgJ [Modicisalibacter ilicicola DSM 19980]|uniref:Peptidoglycan hydrolase FlgJ n=1 Tax=Modicisalibacter ilicicola DSM 19980 TaxID=1121942 RepID=A0A1M4Z0M2_9GAMM|nr:flagellar assembly peptidoglycan hydrolase FlgJ [Halomonas ilicicola]SHF11377.1 flagellar protein FlgJ [Halomonas ilicicola DSM 19980]
MSAGNISSQFALDLQGLQRLKHTAGNAPGEGLEAAAEQFESIFLQMMLKSMRETIPESGLLDSQQSDFYIEMLDKQWSQHLSGQGIGLAEQLINQLEGRGLVPRPSGVSENLIAGIPRGTPRVLHDGLSGDAAEDARSAIEPDSPVNLFDELDLRARDSAAVASVEPAAPRREQPDHVVQFLSRLEAPAERASRTTGVPAKLILAQAALETGWGRHEIPTADGGNSHNLFGIKAGSRWQGATTDITTTEYVNGRPIQQEDRFRVYGSFEEAFTDYARLIGDNPRYSGVITAPDAPAAARALQNGGYATDPAYADKLIAVMESFEKRSPSMSASAGASDNLPGRDKNFSIGRAPTSIF